MNREKYNCSREANTAMYCRLFVVICASCNSFSYNNDWFEGCHEMFINLRFKLKVVWQIHEYFKNILWRWFLQESLYVVCCAIWYHLYYLKKVKNTHGGMLLLVKLQTESCIFAKSNTPPLVFLTSLKLYK